MIRSFVNSTLFFSLLFLPSTSSSSSSQEGAYVIIKIVCVVRKFDIGEVFARKKGQSFNDFFLIKITLLYSKLFRRPRFTSISSFAYSLFYLIHISRGSMWTKLDFFCLVFFSIKHCFSQV